MAQDNTPSDAQLKYQLAQKQAMSQKMAQAAQAAGPGGAANYNVLAQLLQSGKLDPNIMAQLVANVRSDDPSLRTKAMQQLGSLMQLQANQNKSSLNTVAQATAALSNAGGASGTNLQQQQQFLAALQQRAQAQAAQNAANNGQSQQNQAQQQQAAQQGGQTTAQQLQQQQQQLLLQQQQQRQAQLASQQNNTGTAAANTAVPANGPGRPNPTKVWTGTISWTMRSADNTPQKCE